MGGEDGGPSKTAHHPESIVVAPAMMQRYKPARALTGSSTLPVWLSLEAHGQVLPC